jgi:Ca2+-binding RTX toxin-like protein
MAVFELTSGSDLFLATGGNTNHFVGIPTINIDGTDYTSENGGTDSLTGGTGTDNFYIADGASGVFDGGLGTDTFYAYGDLGFFNTYINLEVLFAAAEDDEVVGAAASLLGTFTNITGLLKVDGRVHFEIGIDADLDLGAKMDSGTAGVKAIIDGSIAGQFEINATKFNDYFQVDRTNSSATVSYFGRAGDDTFKSDIDGGLASFFGGMGNDTFIVTENFSFLGQFTEINGGEETGDNDTIESTNGSFTDKTLTGIETLLGTHNSLTPTQAAAIDNYTGQTADPPVVFLNDPASVAWAIFFGGKAPNGIYLDTTGMGGNGDIALSSKDDIWAGNNNTADTVKGGDGKDTFNLVASKDDAAKADQVDGEKGNDVVVVNSSLEKGDKSGLKITGGDGKDRIAVAGTGRLTEIECTSIEQAEFLNGIRLFSETAFLVSLLELVESPQNGAPKAGAAAAGKFVGISIEGKGGTLDLTTKAATLNAGTGVDLDASATTSKVNVTGSTRNDKLTGSTKDDVLKGGKGSDTIVGGNGKDKIEGGKGKDTADYSASTSKVEVTLNGATEAQVKIGGTAQDKLKTVENVIGGLAGDKLTGDTAGNVLAGGRGNDTIKGGGGADKFVFNTSVGTPNVDRIEDFKHDQDKIQLDDAFFIGIGVKLDDTEFYAAAGAKKAKAADDRIIYDTKTGKLYIDADGTNPGTAIHFATLANKPVLDAGDFAMI